MPFTAIVHMCGLVSLVSVVSINTREIQPQDKLVFQNIEDPTIYSPEVEDLLPTTSFLTETRMLIVQRKHGDILKSCEIIDPMDMNLNTIATSKVLEIDEKQMDILADRCAILHYSSRTERNTYTTKHNSSMLLDYKLRQKRTITETVNAVVTGIYPVKIKKMACFNHATWYIVTQGTLWCGLGNDLNMSRFGKEIEADRCCKAHDNCTPVISSGETRDGLQDNALWPKYECTTCNRDFYNCLKEANTTTANAVGEWFFDTFEIGCFDFPLQCNKWGTVTTWRWEMFWYNYYYAPYRQYYEKKICVSKERDNTKEQVLMFHDNPFVYTYNEIGFYY